jgi:hypothetical protein
MRVMGYDVKYSHVLATGAPAGCTGQPQTTALWWLGSALKSSSQLNAAATACHRLRACLPCSAGGGVWRLHL